MKLKKSIIGRWLFNNLSVVVIILFIAEIAFIVSAQNYYYSSAKQYMISKVNAVAGMLSRYSDDTSINFSVEVRNMVENFSDKDKIELMAINSKGRIVLTSSGFSPQSEQKMPDYDEAMEEFEETATVSHGYFVGKSENGEKIMAITYPIISMNINGEYSAIRAVVSLTDIDDHLIMLILAVTAVCIAIMLILISSGIYFISSILTPIKQISETTAKFAKGDFSERIENDSEDEIGNLCTAINHMANELSVAENMKNEFISSVSHELRTPLTAIKGWAETLKEDNDKETMDKGIRVIVNETERLSQMVEELLDFSRMQNGKFRLEMAEMDVLAELGDAVLIYDEKSKRENIELLYDEPEMLPFVYGDKNRIRQVFINIIDNAIKYSDKGGKVVVTATQSGENVRITVADNGCGIKESDLPKVKTKFYKANHTRRGSGIGLAVADEIITMHGGTLEVKSKENVGTTVIITLPPSHKNQRPEN